MGRRDHDCTGCDCVHLWSEVPPPPSPGRDPAEAAVILRRLVDVTKPHRPEGEH